MYSKGWCDWIFAGLPFIFYGTFVNGNRIWLKFMHFKGLISESNCLPIMDLDRDLK